MSTRSRILHHDSDPAPGQVWFEDDRVAMVLKALGLTGQKRELLDAHKRQFDTRRLTFAGFRQRFPTFPVVLAARYAGRVGERVKVADFFRRPETLFLTDLYLETLALLQDEAAGRPVGLVVPFAGYRGGVVVHNGAFDSGGKRAQYPIPGDAPPHRLTAEPFAQLLKYLAAGLWSPEDPGGDALTTARPDPAGVTVDVSPWMARRLGTGPAFAVYIWLTGLMRSSSTRHRSLVRRGKGGVRYLAATQEELAGATGLSAHVVKRGLDRLRKQRLVYSRRGDGRTFLVVVPPEEAESEAAS